MLMFPTCSEQMCQRWLLGIALRQCFSTIPTTAPPRSAHSCPKETYPIQYSLLPVDIFLTFFSFWFSCMECYLRTITFIATSLMALRVTDHSNEHIRVGGVVLNFPPPISQGCRKGEGQGRRLRAGWKSAHFVLPSQERLVTTAKQKSYYARDKTFPNERHPV